MTATVGGISTVVRNLEKLDKAVNDGTRKAVKRAAYMIERDAAINQDAHVDTGRLKASIMVEETSDSVAKVGVAETAFESGARFEVGSSVEYAETIEYRFPFLQPAIEKTRGELPDIIIEDVKREIKQ